MDRPYKQTPSEASHASEPMAAYGRAASLQQGADRTARHEGKHRERRRADGTQACHQ